MCRRNFISVVAALAVQTAALASDNISTTKPMLADYAKQPLGFEPNWGQADNQVEFLAHGNGYSLFLSRGGAVLVTHNAGAVGMKPVGGDHLASAEPLEEQPGKTNYFIGSVSKGWHTNIPNYAKVRYRDVYRGVDLVYYGNEAQLEYDFVVSRGADPGTILLDFKGVTKAGLDRQGNLVMHTTGGSIKWRKPLAYQEFNGDRRFVACDYVRRGGQRLGFRVAAYDRTKPLMIDPVLEYSTYLGGSGFDSGVAIALDKHGNAYVTGRATSTDFPMKNAFQSSLKSPNGNVFVTKLDAAGRLVYSTYLGGSGSNGLGDQVHGIAVDDHGNAYVTGYTDSTDFPTEHAFQATNPGEQAFVTKLDRSGHALVYSTYLGGSSSSYGLSIAVDAQGHAYVTGGTVSVDFPTTKGAFQENLRGQYEAAFVTKFDASGTALVYSTYLGGSSVDEAHGIAVDERGQAYVTGNASSIDFPTKNAFQKTLKTLNGSYNAFVTKFEADGSALVYSTYLGGTAGDQGSSIAVDQRGNAYVTGSTTSADFPTEHAFQKQLNGYANAFVTKFDNDGDALACSTFLGGSGNGFFGDSGSSIAIDHLGNAYVTGSTASVDFPIQNAFQETLNSSAGNAFATKIDTINCVLVYSSYLGGSGVGGDAGSGIAVNERGDGYVTGGTGSTDFPTKNAFQNTNNSMGNPTYPGFIANAFVAKISAR